MRREDANIAQARERERRYLTSIENYPGSRGGSMISCSIEDNLLACASSPKCECQGNGLNHEKHVI
jgi:hypothetical protein